MDKNQKKVKYQELFLSELRNSYFGERKLERSLKEMETTENMKKMLTALKQIWNKEDNNFRKFEEVFAQTKSKYPLHQLLKDKSMQLSEEKKEQQDEAYPLSDQKVPVLSYDKLEELIADLDLDQISDIIKSASPTENDKNNHQYLTKLAEKLVRERDTKA